MKSTAHDERLRLDARTGQGQRGSAEPMATGRDKGHDPSLRDRLRRTLVLAGLRWAAMYCVQRFKTSTLVSV